MDIAGFLSTILPTHPDILPILNDLRAKYDIPKAEPGEDLLPILIAEGLDLESVRADLVHAIRGLSSILPPELASTQALPHIDPSLPLVDLTREHPSLTVSQLLAAALFGLFATPIIQRFQSDIADAALQYLLTGDSTTEFGHWFGGVFTTTIFEGTMIVAMASPLTDLPQLIQEFRRQYRSAFPASATDKTRLTRASAENLRMKLDGYKIGDVANLYIARHPSEFPRNRRPYEFRAAKKTLHERIKKQIQRADDALQARLGDI